MKNFPILTRLSSFWFQPISTAGFGLMRISFGIITLLSLLFENGNILRYFGPHGILPHELVGNMLRSENRFSFLDVLSSTQIIGLYWIFIVLLLLVILGYYTRISVLLSTLILFSFHEYGIITLAGGDTVLRLLAFVLVLAPCGKSFSLDNLIRRWKLAKKDGAEQKAEERMMPRWPMLLLLGQMIIMYASSFFEKMSGTMWLDGSAVAAALHHPHFSRVSTEIANALSYFSPVVSWFVLISQAGWQLLLLPPVLRWIGVNPTFIQSFAKRTKWILLFSGLLIHGLIAILMDVGAFSFAIFAAYLGLLDDADWTALKKMISRSSKKEKIVIFFDGRCGICKKSMVFLESCDVLDHIIFANLYDANLRKIYGCKLPIKKLESSLHIAFDEKTLKGFCALRKLCTYLPTLWLLVPILYLPGMSGIGEYAYQGIAKRRK